ELVESVFDGVVRAQPRSALFPYTTLFRSRRVAVKVIKLGMDTRQVVARFEAERQALAMMDHPNIAKVLDAGATASRTFAMFGWSDRKSTRLNSSHGSISYAVFCLKTKTHT